MKYYICAHLIKTTEPTDEKTICGVFASTPALWLRRQYKSIARQDYWTSIHIKKSYRVPDHYEETPMPKPVKRKHKSSNNGIWVVAILVIAFAAKLTFGQYNTLDGKAPFMGRKPTPYEQRDERIPTRVLPLPVYDYDTRIERSLLARVN